jgi:hypothetical protein
MAARHFPAALVESMITTACFTVRGAHPGMKKPPNRGRFPFVISSAKRR